jgi:hypothetical protein
MNDKTQSRTPLTDKTLERMPVLPNMIAVREWQVGTLADLCRACHNERGLAWAKKRRQRRSK